MAKVTVLSYVAVVCLSIAKPGVTTLMANGSYLRYLGVSLLA